jgi:hypothetical protein
MVMVRRSHPSVVVHSIKLNLGQIPEIDIDANTSGQPSSLIMADRYPESVNGWQLQLDLGENPTTTFAGIRRPLPKPLAATALDLFSDEPVTNIDGISHKWNEILARFKIIRIRDLARLNDSELQKIISENRNIKIREFRQKVLLLELPLPALPHSSLDESSLYQLLFLSQEELHQQLGKNRVSMSEIEELIEFLDILSLALDSRFMKKIPFSQLFNR